MAQHWYVIAPVGSDLGGVTNPKIPPTAKITGVDVGSPQDTAWGNDGAYQGWQRVMGPFNSQAEAQKASPPTGVSAWKDIIGAGVSAGLGSSGLGLSNPLDALSGVAGALSAFYQAITDGAMWRSLGWVALGLVVLLAGVGLWVYDTLNPLHAARQLLRGET